MLARLRRTRSLKREKHKRPARIFEGKRDGRGSSRSAGEAARRRRGPVSVSKIVRKTANARPEPWPLAAFEFDEITFGELPDRMKSGKCHTARAITEKYLEPTRDVDASGPTLRAVIELNPDALAIAAALDASARPKARAARCMASPF